MSSLSRASLPFFALLALGPLGACAARASELKEGEEALRAGRYEEAIKVLKAESARQSSDPRPHRLLTRALAEAGRYVEAEQAARAFTSAPSASAELWNTLGEVLYARGKVEEAETAFQQALSRKASDSLVAEVNLAVLRFDRGQRAQARDGFERLIDAYNSRRTLSSEELTAVGTACRYLGAENPQLFKDALKALDEAVAKDPTNYDAHVRMGEMFLEKYNSPDAEASFKAVLARNPSHAGALLGMARRHEFEGDSKALELTQQSLTVNPNFVPARVFLARLLLDLEQYPRALEEARRALEVNPVDLPALSILAAANYLKGDTAGYDEARRRALARNSSYAELYNEVAEVCVRNRFYRQAVDLARQAVALDPTSWRALGILGLNQLRIGAMENGRRNLEAAFKGDPYNVWIKNTLDLLDTLPSYKESKSPRFLFLVEGKESDLLSPYLAALAEEALDKLQARYAYRPATPIRVEVYRSHADFSVRTVGLAEIGALGVCFGTVLAMDSPSAREAGSFNWGSTLWHELAHAVTLGLTDHRVPRWFTEGLSVYEERRARPGWGDDVSLEFLTVHKQGKLLSLAELNNGFVRPSFPQQVAISYYQASLVVELIERERGFQKVLDLLKAYKEGLSTEEAFTKVMGTSLEAFDRRFKAFLEERFAGALAAVRAPAAPERLPVLTREHIAQRAKDQGDFYAQLKRGQALLGEKRMEEAMPYLERAKALFPEYAEDDSPYWLLAQIQKEKGQPGAAAEELRKLVAINESHYRANLELASLEEQLGNLEAAASALERLLYIHPYEASVHARLAALYSRAGERAKAVRERGAVVALGPVDRAEALYQLALAHFEAGETAAARREVLRALESAPRFEKAQELLLKIPRGTRAKGGQEQPR